jgi:hypothetical protein
VETALHEGAARHDTTIAAAAVAAANVQRVFTLLSPVASPAPGPLPMAGIKGDDGA